MNGFIIPKLNNNSIFDCIKSNMLNYFANYCRPSFITTTFMFIIGNLDENISAIFYKLLKGKSQEI